MKRARNHKNGSPFFLVLTCCVTLGLHFCGCLSSVSAQDISIVVNKKTFDLVEPIPVTVSISNNTDEAIIMPLLFICEDYYLRFEIEHESGKKAEFIGKEIDWIESEHDVLRMFPHSSFSQDVDIRKFYRLELPGKCQVRAVYEVQKGRRTEKDAWHGRLVSAPIEIMLSQK